MATVEYDKSEGHAAGLWWADMRPATIRYAPNRMVRFFYEQQQRPDPIDGFNGGIHTRSAYRINRISMSGGPQGGAVELLREYRLGYQSNSTTGRSLLMSVTECDHDGACKLPVEFTWSLGSNTFDVIDTDISDVGTDQDNGNRVVVLDINGDGRDDLLYPDAENNFADTRAQALLPALPVFRLLPNGFANRDLRGLLTKLLSRQPGQISTGQVTYDLRRLRIHGLITRLPHTHRYEVTDTGPHHALFLTRAHDRLLRIGLARLTEQSRSERWDTDYTRWAASA